MTRTKASRAAGRGRSTGAKKIATPPSKTSGPGRTANEVLEARGSWRAKARQKAEREAAQKKPKARKPKWKALTAAALHKLIRELPGYNPFADAKGCKFDYRLANRALAFFYERLTHVEGALAGKPFKLERWQQAFIANLFGWVRWSEHWRKWVRRTREAFLYVARKNGKTPLAAGICNYVLFEDGEPGAQVISAAAEREQAALLFRHAKGMVENDAALSARAKIYGGTGQRSIVILADQASSYRCISADAYSKHGFNLHMAAIDELHAQPDRELVDVLQTSFASENRAQPLLLHITTADFSRPSICNEKYDYACKVRDGIIKDPAFLPVIYEALVNKDDWTSEKVWAKANPNLGVSVSLDFLRRECARARETPAYENTFKRLHLNMRTEQDVRAIPMERWNSQAVPAVVAELLAGRECYAGLDLSTTTDISAFVLLFPEDDGSYDVMPYFWVPRESARTRERRDRVPYGLWIAAGWIRATEGDVVDYDIVRRDIGELGQRYNIREIAADRWNATQIITQLTGDGFQVIAFGQGFQSMTAPTKELLKLVIEGKLRHGGNPVLRWMASNLATETDAAGNLKPSKKKSTERIDGMVALIMALGRAMVGPTASVYETRGILGLTNHG